MRPMLVVLDSNAFRGDVRADRSRLRSILDGALAKGAFELFVPEVVLQELEKQFAQRSKKVVRDINKALGSTTRSCASSAFRDQPR
jgi:rRNA-processing protein FCF1